MGNIDMKNAYLTFLSTDNYIYYILALWHSWKKTNSKFPLYCVVTDTVSEDTLAILNKISLPYIKVETTPFTEISLKMMEAKMVGKYVNALAKLSIFNMTQFDKCVFLDSDLVIYHNIDDLFDKPEWSAVEDCLPVHKRPQKYILGESSFCSGMFVFKPDYSFYKKIMTNLPKMPKGIKWHDQAILAYYHQDWMQRPELHLPCEYDLLVAAKENVLNMYKQFGGKDSDIKVKHFVSHKDAPYDKKPVYYFWDNVYDEYMNYYKYINSIITKYELPLELCHLDVIYKKSEKLKVEARPLKEEIDIVIPYVDSSDLEWIEVFNKYSPKKIDPKDESIGKERFRGQGNFFRYVFRGIEKNMPWIRDVFLLVQSHSQVPNWINKEKVKIITHDQFIPMEFLPTFNSCTIEMFLWNIPGLSEKFIYINDDFYSIKYLTPEKFFTGDKVVFNKTSRPYLPNSKLTLYDFQCLNCHTRIYGKPTQHFFWKLKHIFRPYLKSEMLNCYIKYKQDIHKSISQFREAKNFNCYLYSLDLDVKGRRLNSVLTTSDTGSNATNKGKAASLLNYDTVCINDSFDANIYSDDDLNITFQEYFPSKSKYELTDYQYKSKRAYQQVYIGNKKVYLYF